MSADRGISIRQARLGEILDLRWRILRAGLARETAHFDGDEEPATRHFAAVRGQDGAIVGCATIVRRPWNDAPAWQLRGMAVDPQLQCSGIGRMLLDAVEQVVVREPFSLQLWCNARTPATPFYLKCGWHLVGEEFIIPTAGPHYRMEKSLHKAT